MSILVPNNLQAGGSIEITITSQSRKGSTVVLTIDNGLTGTDREETTLTIQIDAQGSGKRTWEVPDWLQARFTDGKCTEQVRPISASQPPPGGALAEGAE